MKRTEMLKTLCRHKEQSQGQHGFTKIGIFGSVAQGGDGTDSDLDVVLELMSADLFVLGSINADLEEAFGKRFDIVRLREGMNPFLKKRIDEEAVYVGPWFF